MGDSGDRDAAKIFVGALSWDTSDDALKDAFIKHGEIVEARVSKRSRPLSAHAHCPRARGASVTPARTLHPYHPGIPCPGACACSEGARNAPVRAASPPRSVNRRCESFLFNPARPSNEFPCTLTCTVSSLISPDHHRLGSPSGIRASCQPQPSP
jgi:hypothetical protein